MAATPFPTVHHPRPLRVIRVAIHRDFVKQSGQISTYINVVLTPSMTCKEATILVKHLLSLSVPATAAPAHMASSSESLSAAAEGTASSSRAEFIAMFLKESKLWSVCLGEAVPYDLLAEDTVLWDITGGTPRPKFELRKGVSKAPRSFSVDNSVIVLTRRDSGSAISPRKRKNIGRTLSVNLSSRKSSLKLQTPSASFQPLPSKESSGSSSSSQGESAFPGIRMLSEPVLLHSEANADRLGYLYYRSQTALSSKWKKHFFRLSDGCLYQYKKEWSPGTSSPPPRRIVSLENMFVTPLTKQESGKAYAFCLRYSATAVKPGKPLFLAVPTQYDLSQWMKFLNTHIEDATVKTAGTKQPEEGRCSSFGGVPLPLPSPRR